MDIKHKDFNGKFESLYREIKVKVNFHTNSSDLRYSIIVYLYKSRKEFTRCQHPIPKVFTETQKIGIIRIPMGICNPIQFFGERTFIWNFKSGDMVLIHVQPVYQLSSPFYHRNENRRVSP